MCSFIFDPQPNAPILFSATFPNGAVCVLSLAVCVRVVLPRRLHGRFWPVLPPLSICLLSRHSRPSSWAIRDALLGVSPRRHPLLSFAQAKYVLAASSRSSAPPSSFYATVLMDEKSFSHSCLADFGSPSSCDLGAPRTEDLVTYTYPLVSQRSFPSGLGDGASAPEPQPAAGWCSVALPVCGHILDPPYFFSPKSAW